MGCSSKTFFFRLIPIFLLHSTFAATEAFKIFDEFRDSIERAPVFEKEGYLFASARVTPRSDTSAALEGALKKARFQAKLQMLDYAIGQEVDLKAFDVEESLFPHLQSALRHFFLEGRSLELKGIETVWEQKETDYSTSILAVPIKVVKELNFPREADWSREIIHAAIFEGANFDPFLVSELAEPDEMAAVMDFWIRYLEQHVGAGELRRAVTGLPVREIPKGVLSQEQLNNESFWDLSVRESLKYFPLFLNHPGYCRALAGKATAEGFRGSKIVFYGIGATFPIANADQAYCASMFSGSGFNWPLPHQSGSLPSVELDPAGLQGLIPPEGTLARIILSQGGYKLSEPASESEDRSYQLGVDAFFSNPPDLEKAQGFFMEAVETSPSSNACNMLGRCFTLNGQSRLGAILGACQGSCPLCSCRLLQSFFDGAVVDRVE